MKISGKLLGEILGGESFTHWFKWDASARELGKIERSLHPHRL